MLSAELLTKSLGVSGLSLILLIIFGFLFWKPFLGLIQRSIKKDVEKFKHELDLQKENIRYDLNKEMIKEQFQNTSIQTIYPEMMEKLIISEGAVQNLFGFRYTINFEDFGPDDIREYLIDKNFTIKLISELVYEFESDKKLAIKKIRSLLREGEFQEVHLKYSEAKNLFLTKGLFFSTEINSKIEEILNLIFKIYIYSKTFGKTREQKIDLKLFQQDKESLVIEIKKLEKIMRSELYPS